MRPTTVALVADEVARCRIELMLDRRSFEVTLSIATPLTAADAALLRDELTEVPAVAIVCGGPELLRAGGTLERLGELLPGCRVVIVTPSEDRGFIRRALHSGASGLLAERTLAELLPTTLRAVSAGQLCVPRSLNRRVNVALFSTRERQVLELIAQGLTNAEIADRLFLSESTVKSHLSSSFRKLGVSSRAEAAAMVLETEAISPSSETMPSLERQLLATA